MRDSVDEFRTKTSVLQLLAIGFDCDLQTRDLVVDFDHAGLGDGTGNRRQQFPLRLRQHDVLRRLEQFGLRQMQ